MTAERVISERDLTALPVHDGREYISNESLASARNGHSQDVARKRQSLSDLFTIVSAPPGPTQSYISCPCNQVTKMTCQ
jgi:hypothetical protein